jgi:hypothetical protein
MTFFRETPVIVQVADPEAMILAVSLEGRTKPGRSVVSSDVASRGRRNAAALREVMVRKLYVSQFQALRPVVLGIIHPQADRASFHALAAERHKQRT